MPPFLFCCTTDDRRIQGSVCVSRAGVGVALKQGFERVHNPARKVVLRKVCDRGDRLTTMRDACAIQDFVAQPCDAWLSNLYLEGAFSARKVGGHYASDNCCSKN